MNNLAQGSSRFEAIKHIDSETGQEYWLARELQPILGYTQWHGFLDLIERAKVSCETQGYEANQHFSQRSVKNTFGRPSIDYRITRFGCYILTMCGDVRKPQIANGQGYFAVNARKQELIEETVKNLDAIGLFEYTLNAVKQIHSDNQEIKAQVFQLTSNVDTVKGKQEKLEDSLTIDAKERGELRGLVEQIVLVTGYHWQTVWSKSNKHFGVSGYAILPKRDFQNYKVYLQECLKAENAKRISGSSQNGEHNDQPNV